MCGELLSEESGLCHFFKKSSGRACFVTNAVNRRVRIKKKVFHAEAKLFGLCGRSLVARDGWVRSFAAAAGNGARHRGKV